MRKLFLFITKPLLNRKKESFSKATSAGKSADAKTEVYLPMAFDFTAYFDDDELENNEKDISRVNPVVGTRTDVFCINIEKCNEMHYSSNSKQLECCIIKILEFRVCQNLQIL